MLNRRDLLYEYELILTGERLNYSSGYFVGTPENQQKVALEFVRFAVEIFLKWTPQEMEQYFDNKVIDRMKLRRVISYINFPQELNPKESLFYLAHLLYPTVFEYSPNDLVLKMYKVILADDGSRARFPKEYMRGNEGISKACICLQYMLQTNFRFKNVREMYELFASTEGGKILKQYKLYLICNQLFESPVDFIHETLIESQKNESYFYYYKFMYFYRKGVSSFTRENNLLKKAAGNTDENDDDIDENIEPDDMADSEE